MHAVILALALAQLPTYPGAVHTRIGDDLEIGGELYRIAYFTTVDSPLDVAEHFVREWRRRGYPTTAIGDFRSEGVVSAFLTREGVQRAVVVRREGMRTLAFTMVKDLRVRPVTRKPVPPLPPEQARVVNAEPGEVRRRLIDETRRAGFELARETELGSGRTLIELTRRGKHSVAAIGPAGEGRAAVVRIDR
jgi:hypothetical protein